MVQPTAAVERGRRVGESRFVCCASPEYLANRSPLRVPDDLVRHDCFAYAYSATTDAWTFEAPDGTRATPRLTFRHRANNGRMLVAMAVAGLGITMEPDFIVAPEVRSGRLVRVLPDYRPPTSPVSVLYRGRRTRATEC